MNKFQFIVLGIFVICIGVGVAVFALYKGDTSSNSLPAITVWGTFPASQFNDYVNTMNNDLQQPIQVKYTEYKQSEFSQSFIEALARGKGPDAILIPAEYMLQHQDKIVPIPYATIPQRNYLDAYIDEAQLYLKSSGALAFPFTVDPLVMYWNKDTFNSASIASYPRTWDEFTALNKKLTVLDKNGLILKSAVALGDFTNVVNAREILGTLFMQIGNPVTAVDSDGLPYSTIKVAANINPTAALSFFTQFVDSSNANYSWNRSFDDSKTTFLAGNLATYFGFASELTDLHTKNANLNFDVAPLPQVKNSTYKSTYGRMYGLSIVRSSANPTATYTVLSILIKAQYLNAFSDKLHLPSVYRSYLNAGSKDPYVSIFNSSALIAHAWIDADPAQSNTIFASMVNAVTSGQKTTNQAIQDAGDQYDVVLKKASGQ